MVSIGSPNIVRATYDCSTTPSVAYRPHSGNHGSRALKQPKLMQSNPPSTPMVAKPSGVVKRAYYKRRHNMIYDTGANITSMTPTTLQHIGYNPNRTTNVYHVNSNDASGNVTRRKVLRDVWCSDCWLSYY